MKELAIQTQKIIKSFGENEVLKGVDLKVEENSIYGFLGPNGAGKTTTIKIILGLLRPTSGKIRVLGKDFRSNSLEIKSQLGYLPQHPQFYDYLTAREILDYTMKFYFTGPQDKIEDRIELLLDLVSLGNKADRAIRGYSGGERRRLGIAQSMINFPKLLILDEPAAALDPIGRKDVLKVMEQLRDYTTIFYSTHILDDVQRVSDQVAILNGGQIIAEGEIDTLLAGGDGILYDIWFTGDIEKTRQRLTQLDWVADVLPQPKENGLENWMISVTNEEKASKILLRYLLQDEALVVHTFAKKKFELEDIFMKVVGDGQ